MTEKKCAFAVAVAMSVIMLSGCSDENASAISRTEEATAQAYVAALNARDVNALTRLAPAGYEGIEAEAREIIKAEGGRGLKIKDVQVSHDFGEDVASAHVSATDSRSKPFSANIQMSLEKDKWVVALGYAPEFNDTDKSSSSTDK
ncbi:hypothetical protein ACWGIA_17390 [Streptomyces bobili]